MEEETAAEKAAARKAAARKAATAIGQGNAGCVVGQGISIAAPVVGQGICTVGQNVVEGIVWMLALVLDVGRGLKDSDPAPGIRINSAGRRIQANGS